MTYDLIRSTIARVSIREHRTRTLYKSEVTIVKQASTSISADEDSISNIINKSPICFRFILNEYHIITHQGEKRKKYSVLYLELESNTPTAIIYSTLLLSGLKFMLSLYCCRSLFNCVILNTHIYIYVLEKSHTINS